MSSKRSAVVALSVGLVFVLLFHSFALTPSIAAPLPTPPAEAREWRLYEPVAEVVIPTGDANAPRAVEEKDGYVYLLAREGILYTYDVSDLPLRESFTTYNAPVNKQALYSGNGNGLLRHGNYLYVFGRNGLDTIDVQDPCLPAPLSLSNDLNIYNMVRHENYLIAAGRQRIAVYSIEEPSNPALLSDLNMGQEQQVWSAAAYGSTLYACHWTSDWQGSYTNSLSMIDFSNPTSLSVLNTISRDDHAYHLRVVGSQLVECTSNQVGLWDLTAPANPVFLTSQPAGGRVAAQDGDTIVTNGKVLRPNGNELRIVATFTPGGSQRDGFPHGSAVNASFVFIAQSARILILHAGPPVLSINYASGGAGSFFTVTGHDFPPNSSATIVVNRHTLGDVATGTTGEFLCLFNTEQANEGRYIVTVTANHSASTRFVIASGEPVHPQEGSGTILQVPSGIAYVKYGGGNGMAEDPYQIATAEDLMLLGDSPQDYGKHFILTADINLDPNLPDRKVFDKAVIAPNWEMPFTGVFDGDGHTISHLRIGGGEYLGLFGELGFEAVVSDLGVVDVNISGSGANVGGLAGYNVSGSVTDCYSTGVVHGRLSVGGLVGYNDRAEVARCYSTGTVSGAEWYVGGLMGYNGNGTVTQCYSTGTVSGYSSVGGLVGQNEYWATDVLAYSGVVSQCYSSGSISGVERVGGLVGQNDRGYVSQCYSTGPVSGTSTVGGLVGRDYQGNVTACFWDTQASGQATSAGGAGKTTVEMQAASTFLEAGWDFVGETANGADDIWRILEGQDYPHLWWETHN
jgi:hypothetical protein